MSSFVVRFEGRWQPTVEVSMGSRPIVLPGGLEILHEDSQCLILTQAAPEDGVGGNDVVVGSFPLVSFRGGHTHLDWLEIPPPRPLVLADIHTMWDEVVALNAPIPAAVSLQGKSATHGIQLISDAPLIELLSRSDLATRQLLKRWPSSRDSSLRWQHLELPGGREDLVATERLGSRLVGLRLPDGKRFPDRSARRTQQDRPWTSNTLSHAAHVLAMRVGLLAGGKNADDLSALQAPLVKLSRRSLRREGRVDPPLSSWPSGAASAYLAILSALTLIESDVLSGSHERRAPLCSLWSLYEAWVGARTVSIVDSLGHWERKVGPAHVGGGASWCASWRSTDGSESLHLVSQFQLGLGLSDLDGRLPLSLRSITSDLRPDFALIRTHSSGKPTMMIVDAKFRASGVMDASAVAESASKYVWGIRTGAGGDSDVHDANVVLVSNAAETSMFDTELSQIRTSQLLPTSDAGWTNFLSAL